MSGIGTWLNKAELQTIASYPYNVNYINVPSGFAGLDEQLKVTLRDLICDSKFAVADLIRTGELNKKLI